MKIGVKFCGGCNPTYDRKKFLDRTIEEYPFYEFEMAQPDVRYPELLVICGCQRCCADYSALSYGHLNLVGAEDTAVDFVHGDITGRS